MNFEKEWKSSRDLFIKKLKNGDFTDEYFEEFLSEYNQTVRKITLLTAIIKAYGKHQLPCLLMILLLAIT